jgi:hypothetical protein
MLKTTEPMNATEKECQKRDTDKAFIMRQDTRSTTYEVAVYFSRTSRETMADKILRLIQSDARQ